MRFVIVLNKDFIYVVVQ